MRVGNPVAQLKASSPLNKSSNRTDHVAEPVDLFESSVAQLVLGALPGVGAATNGVFLSSFDRPAMRELARIGVAANAVGGLALAGSYFLGAPGVMQPALALLGLSGVIGCMCAQVAMKEGPSCSDAGAYTDHGLAIS